MLVPIRKDISLKALFVISIFCIIELWFCIACFVWLLTHIPEYMDFMVLAFDFGTLPDFSLGLVTFFPWYFWPTFFAGLGFIIFHQKYLVQKTEEEKE